MQISACLHSRGFHGADDTATRKAGRISHLQKSFLVNDLPVQRVTLRSEHPTSRVSLHRAWPRTAGLDQPTLAFHQAGQLRSSEACNSVAQKFN